jgi:ketosteroid isomerase-like protein
VAGGAGASVRATPAPTQEDDVTNPELSPEQAEAAARAFFDVFSTGDVPAILGALTDDVTWTVSGKIAGMSGSYDKPGFGALIGGVADVYEAPLTITPTAVHVAGDWVTLETQSYARLKDGRVYDPAGVFVVRVAPDGRLADVREYFDTLHAHETFFSR